MPKLSSEIYLMVTIKSCFEIWVISEAVAVILFYALAMALARKNNAFNVTSFWAIAEWELCLRP